MPVSSTTRVREFYGICIPAAKISAFAVSWSSSAQLLSIPQTYACPEVRVSVDRLRLKI
jgi:hypothetical protein|tara:strand:+ start:466 stop:642 length:177 start_codon:yes stop_codon:yes gene_type:complete